jgi:hypothetical protein
MMGWRFLLFYSTNLSPLEMFLSENDCTRLVLNLLANMGSPADATIRGAVRALNRLWVGLK